MPKELKEIRNFTEGTILNASERDIPGDSNVYSLNINPTAEHGILDAIKVDRLITTIDGKDTYFRDPVSWSATNNIDSDTGDDSYNYPGIYIEDISVFDNEGVTKLNFIGTQGRKEQLLVKSIEPIFEDTTINIDIDSILLETDEYFTDAGWDEDNLAEGEYFSIKDSFAGRYDNTEIMQFLSYDSATNRIYVKRRCFGTSSTKIPTNAEDLWAGRITINSVQSRTTAGTATLSGWSDYSGNNIGGNSHYLNWCDDAAQKRKNGYNLLDSSNSTVQFTASTNTITFGSDITALNFHEGDIITCYYDLSTDNNCGKSFKILKKATSPLVLTVEGVESGDAMVDETLAAAADFYMESNLIKNFTFSHAIDPAGGGNVGTNYVYKANHWAHRTLALDASSKATNYYQYVTTTSSVVWSTTATTPFEATYPPYGTGDNTDNFYPFTNNTTGSAGATTDVKRYMAMFSSYAIIAPTLKVGTTLTTSSTKLEFNIGTGDMGEHLAEGDIICFEENDFGGINNDTEYMEVVSIEGAIVTVTRGAFGSAPVAASLENAHAPFKCRSTHIRQFIAKEKLKEGQEYVLSFYAQGTSAPARGSLAITFNGGYINSSGVWTPFKNDPKSGYIKAGNEKTFAQEYRWIDFGDLDKINTDTAANDSGIDDIWRRLDLRFTIPKGQKLDTDISLELASRGEKGSLVYVDRVTLNEYTKVYASIEDGNRIDNAAFIDNSGIKVLAMYDSTQASLSAIQTFNIDAYEHSSAIFPLLSPFTSSDIQSSRDSASFVKNNREVHIGFGGSNTDSAPQWLGYINNKVFGESLSNQLYQDEDTVHKYDETGGNTLSKLCLAGEFENLKAYWNNSGGSIDASAISTVNSLGTTDLADNTLRILNAAHSMNTGDNIVVREWLDVDNSWDGNGVWIITNGDATNYFDCKRFNTLDKDPNEEGIFTTDTNGMDTATGTLTVETNAVNADSTTDHNLQNGDYIIIYDTTSTDFETGATSIGPVTRVDSDTFTVAHATTTDNEEGTIVKEFRLNYRPYYYYGCKDGDDRIYRISPSTRITNGLADDTVYTAGKMEASLPLPSSIKSITTCYNKEDDGTGGGRIYALSSISDEVYVVNVNVAYNTWASTAPSTHILSLEFKSFKWSNDSANNTTNSNGNIAGTTEVFGGLASESTPTIEYAGQLSDILETKGTNSTFEFAADANTDNAPVDFGTRLWVQCTPAAGSSFSEGSRFLFCGLTNTVHDATSTVYCGDRSPPTTICANTNQYYDWQDWNFMGAPSILKTTATFGGYSYGHYTGNLGHIYEIKPLTSTSPTAYGYFRARNAYHSYYKFGNNVGWAKDIYNDTADVPAIQVAKYGLFQMADNDQDGLIDSTGVVCENDVSAATGLPYGRIHQRVTSHVVGLIGGCDKPWQRDWGSLASTGGENWYTAEHNTKDWCGANHTDAPEKMNATKCIWVCSDIHYGDKTPTSVYYDAATSVVGTFRGSSSPSTGTIANNAIKLTLTAAQVGTMQAGDIVFCADENVKAESFNTYIAETGADYITLPVSATDADGAGGANLYEAEDYYVFPYSPHPVCQEIASDDSSTPAVDSMKGSFPKMDSILFHHAYDDVDSTNGDIFTEGYGCGKYTRTFVTTPSQHGFSGGETIDTGKAGAGIAAGFTFNPSRPGVLQAIEKLNFRAGYMMRPFMMDDGEFEDLIIGNNTVVEMPSWPGTPVFNKQETSLNHKSINSANNENQFASKLFISSDKSSDEAHIYQIDMNFMYPDLAIHQASERQDSGSTTSDDFNDGSSWDIMMAGEVIGYVDTSVGTMINDHIPLMSGTAVKNWQPKMNATFCPIVRIKGSTDTIYNPDMLGAAGPYRQDGALAGMCISIVDGTTGKIQTRYIVHSHNMGKAATDEVYAHVHYPFQHAPTAADKWYIWDHKNVCTAPVRLLKETPLTHDLGTALIADPTLNAPIYKNEGAIDSFAETGGVATATTAAIHGLSIYDLIDVDAGAYTGESLSITVTGPKTFSYTSSGTGAATGTWSLIDNTGSTANPLKLNLAAPRTLTTFGGLDMRKLKSYTVDSVSSTSGTEQKLHVSAPAAHLLLTGDTITYNTGAGEELDGTYIIDKVDDDEIDITTPQADTDTGTITTNQWESIVLESGGKSGMGELRSGFNSWDKGDIQSNIIRHDSTTETDIFMSFSEGSVSISAGSSGDATGDYFLKNTDYEYKISLMYDGYQEGPLSNSSWSYTDASKTRSKLNLIVRVSNFSNRLSHVCVYRRDNTDNFFSLVKQISVETGWGQSGGAWAYTLGDKGELGPTYESRTGLSELLDTIRLQYGISTEVDGYLFAGDCGHDKIENASNLIFRSKPGMFSIFDYANDFLTIKSKPTAMANFLGRLFVFDSNNIYKINPHSLAIEDTFEGVGCLGKDSLIVTEYGMFFADSNGAYKHDGNSPVKISEPIQNGGDTTTFGVGESVSPTDNINDVSWNNMVANRGSIPFVTFDSSGSNILFIIKYNDKSTSTISSIDYHKNIEQYYAWSYNIPRERWDLWELDADVDLGAPIINEGGEVMLPIDNALYELQGGSSKKDYTWISKKLNGDDDSTVKIFKKIKVNGIDSDLNLGGSNKESSDRLFVSTSKGTIASSDLTYSAPSTGHGDYKVGGSNKSARWLQIKFENMTEPVDSLGIIFRRKRVK